MSLKKKKDTTPTTTEKTTVIVQPIAMDKKPETAPNLNKRGKPYLSGRQVAAGIATFIPVVASSFSVVNNIEDASTKIRVESLTGKAKAKVIAKTAAKVGVKFVAGIVAGHCVYQQLDNTFDLNK